MVDNKALKEFVAKHEFDTGDTHGWVDFTKKFITKFKLSSRVKENENGTCIELYRDEKKLIENAYFLVEAAETTIDYIFEGNIINKPR